MIKIQIDKIRLLREGWLRGYGKVPAPEALDWFEQTYSDSCSERMPPPLVVPTIFGSIQLEWSFGDVRIDLSVSLKTKTGHFRKTNSLTKEFTEIDYDLQNSNAWRSIEKHVVSAREE
jgi:hypothetical protein